MKIIPLWRGFQREKAWRGYRCKYYKIDVNTIKAGADVVVVQVRMMLTPSMRLLISAKSAILMATMVKIPTTTFVPDVDTVPLQQDSETVGIHTAGCNLRKLTKFQTKLASTII